MTFWIFLWKAFFIITVSAFAFMAVWVTIGGWHDIKELFHELSQRKQPDPTHANPPAEPPPSSRAEPDQTKPTPLDGRGLN